MKTNFSRFVQISLTLCSLKTPDYVPVPVPVPVSNFENPNSFSVLDVKKFNLSLYQTLKPHPLPSVPASKIELLYEKLLKSGQN